jgi:peptide/nickel transport system substrate-binding protein
MRYVLKGLIAVAAMCMAAGGLEAGKKDDTLVWATDREVPITDWNFLVVRELVIVSSLVYDRLLHLDENYQVKPALATAWTWADDTTLDLDLRKGVKFHSGKELDADDVVYTISFLANKENGSPSLSYVSHIKSAEKLESHKVRLRLHKPFPATLAFLGGVTNIMAKGHYDNAPAKSDGKKDFGAVPANGTGPYKVTEMKPGESILMEKNADYWEGSPKGKPQIGKIKFRSIKDSNTRLAEVMTGAIDWIWELPQDQAERLKSAPNLAVDNAKTLRIAFLTFDAKGVSGQKAFTDKRVRQAINYAINRKAIVDNMMGSPAEVINSACHPDQIGCTSDVPNYEYNPEKAKALLKEAGYANGFEFNLYAYREREHTEAMIGDLVKIGLKPKLNYLQYTPLIQAVHKGEAASVHLTWGSNGIPDVSACAGYWFDGSKNDTSQDPEITRMIAEADAVIDPAKRKELWRKVLVRIQEEAYWVPLFTYAKYYVYSKELDFKVTPDELPQFFRTKWK